MESGAGGSKADSVRPDYHTAYSGILRNRPYPAAVIRRLFSSTLHAGKECGINRNEPSFKAA